MGNMEIVQSLDTLHTLHYSIREPASGNTSLPDVDSRRFAFTARPFQFSPDEAKTAPRRAKQIPKIAKDHPEIYFAVVSRAPFLLHPIAYWAQVCRVADRW